MDKKTAAQIHQEIDEALKAILAKHGLKQKKNGLKYNEVGFKFTLEVIQPGAVNNALLEKASHENPDIDFKTPVEIAHWNGTFRVIDCKSRGEKCWVIEDIKTQKQGLISWDQLRRFFGKKS